MLKKSKVNLIVLITPHNTHAPLALKCLKAGRHVVCEKPLAITTEEVNDMIAAAEKSDVMLSTYHNRHWDGRIRQAVDRIKKKKEIGDIVRIELHMGGYGQPGNWWRTSRKISGGILYDWGRAPARVRAAAYRLADHGSQRVFASRPLGAPHLLEKGHQ